MEEFAAGVTHEPDQLRAGVHEVTVRLERLDAGSQHLEKPQKTFCPLVIVNLFMCHRQLHISSDPTRNQEKAI